MNSIDEMGNMALNEKELNKVAGGMMPGKEKQKMYVNVEQSYLALRSSCECNPANEIGKLWNGDCVLVLGIDLRNATQYVWVEAPSLGQSGYVNKNFLRS